MNTKTSAFPAYADWLSDYCKQHDDIGVRDSWSMIDYCLQLDQKIPNEYVWMFQSPEGFRGPLAQVSTAAEVNHIFWTDQVRNIEAYSLTTFWRGIELLKPAIRSLNIHEIITPAVLSRSLLELSCVFLIHANNIEKSFSEIKFPNGTVVGSPELEKMIAKMLCGTRYKIPEEHHLKQNNVLSFIKKASKNPKSGNPLDVYEYLCDIAHPSHIGNTRFWSHIDKVNDDGSERRIIGRYSNGPSTNEILDKIIWSLGWSAAVLRNSFEIMSGGLAQLLEKTKLSESGR